MEQEIIEKIDFMENGLEEKLGKPAQIRENLGKAAQNLANPGKAEFISLALNWNLKFFRNFSGGTFSDIFEEFSGNFPVSYSENGANFPEFFAKKSENWQKYKKNVKKNAVSALRVR